MKYTKAIQARLFKIEHARLKKLGKIAASFYDDEQRNTFEQKMIIFADYIKASNENQNDIMEQILGTTPDVTRLHTDHCINSDVAKCICGNSMLSNRNLRPSRQKGFYIL